MELFPDDDIATRWITLARQHVPIEGMPATGLLLGFGQRKRFGLAVNELIRRGEVKGQVRTSIPAVIGDNAVPGTIDAVIELVRAGVIGDAA